MASWLFQGNPKLYKIRSAIHHFKQTAMPTTWLVTRHQDHIRQGDEAYFWEAGPRAGLVGWGTIQIDPANLNLEPAETPFVVQKAKFEGLLIRVRITVEGECYLGRNELRENPILANWAPISKGVTGTNFAIPPNPLVEISRLTKGR
jgi:hypothetical protein